MNKRHFRLALAVVLALALFLSACRLFREPEVVEPEWVSNYTGIEVDTPSGSTHDALDVDQVGEGDIMDLKDGGTTVAQVADGGDWTVTGDFELTGSFNPSVGIEVANVFTVTASEVEVGVDGDGISVTIHSNTGSDLTRWNATAPPRWEVTSADGSDALRILDGDVEITDSAVISQDLHVVDTLNVDGDIDLDGDGLDMDITSGSFYINADASSAITVSGAGVDLTLHSGGGEVVVKGDEAAPTAITLDANEAADTGLTIVVGSSGGMSVDGGLTDVGTGTYYKADGNTDVGVAGDFEVRTGLYVASQITGTATGLTTGIDGTGIDVEFYGGTASATWLWDASEEQVVLTGVNGQDAINIADGNLEVKDGGYFGTSVISATATGLTTGIDDEGVDVRFYGDTTGKYMLWDDGGDRLIVVGVSGTAGIDLVAGDFVMENDDQLSNSEAGTITATVTSGGSFAVSTGNLYVSDGGTPSLTLNGNDAYIEGTLEADGAVRFDDDVTLGVGNLTISNGYFVMANDEAIYNNTNAVITVGIEAISEYTLTATALELGANSLGLDADGNSTFTADTNDQLDLALGGTDVVTFTTTGVEIGGWAMFDMRYTAHAVSTTLTLDDCGQWFSNAGSTSTISETLPGAVAGCWICFIDYDAEEYDINPVDGTDTILSLTNAAGDEISSNGSQGQNVCLLALDATYWTPMTYFGTWNDED